MAEALQRREPTVAVIIIGGSATNVDRDRVHASGLVLLEKPVTFRDFSAALDLARARSP